MDINNLLKQKNTTKYRDSKISEAIITNNCKIITERFHNHTAKEDKRT